MRGKRKRRCGQLPRQLALGLLEDAMGRVEQPRERDEGELTVETYPGSAPSPGTRAQADLGAAGVPVDNSAGPDSADSADPVPPRERELPVPRTGESARRYAR